MDKTFSSLFIISLLVLSTSCAGNNNPQLSPAGQAAATVTQVIHAIDVVRDTAIAANAQNPPLISTDNTRKIVNFHESAVKLMVALPTGWKSAVLTSLDELQKNVTIAEWNQISVYVVALKTLIAGVA